MLWWEWNWLTVIINCSIWNLFMWTRILLIFWVTLPHAMGFFLSRALCCFLKHSVHTHMFIFTQAGRGQQAAVIQCEGWSLTLWSTWLYKSHPKPSTCIISLHWDRFTVHSQMEVLSNVTMYICTIYSIISD